MRPVPAVRVLLLLFALALLCAAPVSGWAAPTILEYGVSHLTVLGFWGESIGWSQHVGARVYDAAGLDNIAGVSVSDPAGTVHPSPNDWTRRMPDNGTGTVCFCVGWDELAVPVGGPYTLVARGRDGTESAPVVTSAFSHFAQPTPEVTYPNPGSVIPEANPLFRWPLYPGFSGEGAPPVVSQGVGVTGPDGCLWVQCGLDVTATSTQYGTGIDSPPPLQPGETYWARLWESGPVLPEVAQDGFTQGWHYEKTGRVWSFTISSPGPVIQWMYVDRGPVLDWSGWPSYFEEVGLSVSDSDGVEDIASVTVTDSRGQVHEAELRSLEGPTTAQYWWPAWGQDAPSPAGTYRVTVSDRAGHTDSATGVTTELPADLPAIVTPEANYGLTSEAPAFSWTAPPGVGCFCMGVAEANAWPGSTWSPPGPVTSPLSYSESALLPGHVYDWFLSYHVRDGVQADPRVTCQFRPTVNGRFIVYSPLPTIQTADIWRWRCLCPDPGCVESLCEGARVSVLDLDGWQDVSVITGTPDGLQLPDPLGWDCSTNDGSYVLSQTSGHNAPGLNSGSYTITASDAAGATVSLVSGQVAQVPPLHRITSPSNGAVLAETELTPTFSWESAPGAAFSCVCVKDRGASDTVIWVKRDIPGDVTSVVYSDDGQGQPLVPGGRYLVVVRVHYPDEDANDGVAVDTLTGASANFSVYSPLPVIQTADICRARCLCSDPGSVEFYHEGVRISALDLDGWQDVSVSTQTPDGLSLPDPLGCGSTTNDGHYVLNTKDGHSPASLGAGSYTISATDTAGATVGMVSGQVSEVPPMHQITYPANGAVLPEGELTPTFSWAGASGAAYSCICVKDRGANDAVIWVRRDVPGDVTSIVYNDDGTATPLSAGGRYRVQVRVHYADEDLGDGVAVDTFTAANANFSIYSSRPVITLLRVDRGSSVSPKGITTYMRSVNVVASDSHGAAHITSVSLTDSGGVRHDVPKVCGQDQVSASFCWQSWDEPAPSPPGTYTVTVTDGAGDVDSATTEVSALPDDPGFVPVLGTPANYSVTTAAPEFSWSVPLGEGSYFLGVWEESGACQLWCPWQPSSPIAYGGADLLPGHIYNWSLSSYNPDTIAQSDPAALSRFMWSATGRFWVEPKFVGFLDPINDDGSSIFHLGSTVPVKFRLFGADGNQITDAACELHVAKVTDNVTGTYEEATSTGAADSGNSFRYADGHYQFNLGTTVLSAGTYRLRVTVNGANAHETTISLK